MGKKIDRTCTNNCSDVCGECQIPTKKMEKKQTAVEWLHCQLDELEMTRHKRFRVLHLDLRDEIFKEAKQLEKQQIVDAHKANAVVYEMDATAQAERYYTENYESERSS